MARLPVEVLNLLSDGVGALKFAIIEATRVQEEFHFSLLPNRFSDDIRLNVKSDTHSTKFFDALIAKRAEWRGYHPFIVSFIDSALNGDNWTNLFSARRGEHGLAIVTDDSVSEIIVPKEKMAAYYLYELAVHTLAFIVSGKEHHKEQRGCVFDSQINKIGILDSMKAGAICDDCKDWFLENGRNLSSAQLAAINHLLARCAELLETTATNSKLRVFIGSSVEGLEIARAIQSKLQYDYSVEIWNQNTIFGLGTSTIEALEEATQTYDYAIFVFTPDDLTQSREVFAAVPRDNVIFESGLFIGKLSRFRSFIVHPRDESIQLPSDLNGMTMATYDSAAPIVDAGVGPACRKIRLAIENSG